MNKQQAGSFLQGRGPQGHMLAHITPREGKILQFFGGSGKKHKKTGLRSYATGDPDHLGGLGNSGAFAGLDNKEINVGAAYNKASNYVNNFTPEQAAANHANFQNNNNGQGMGRGSGVSAAPGLPNPITTETRTNTNTSTSSLDKPVEEFRDKVLAGGTDVLDEEYEAYDGDRFEDKSQDTKDAMQQVRDAQGTGQDAYTASGKVAAGVAGYAPDKVGDQSFLSGKGVDKYMNPHTSNVISGMQDNAMRTMQMQREALGSKAQMSGAGMGSRSALEKGAMQGEVMRNLNQQTGQMLNQSYRDASAQKRADMNMARDADKYNVGANERAQGINLAGAEAGSRAADRSRSAAYEDASRLSQVGAANEAYGQRDKDFAYDEWDDKKNFNREKYAWGANLLSGAPSGQEVNQSNPMYKTKNRFGNAMAGAAAGSTFGPWGAAAGGALGYFS